MAAGTMLTRLLITVIIHLVFLASVFDIYFKSPIMEPFLHHKPGYESGTAPAKRVVIFVSDGLQADSFYEKVQCMHIRL
jgi:phosphatidylinositol glycan class N